jgi:hypothetical protein
MLDDNETISAGLEDASEEKEPDRYHQFFVHGALVGNTRKMLRRIENIIFDQEARRDGQTSIRCYGREAL